MSYIIYYEKIIFKVVTSLMEKTKCGHTTKQYGGGLE